MSRVETAAAFERLPWLSDEPAPQPATRSDNALLGWVVAGTAVVAGAGFWMGANSVDEPSQEPLPRASTTVRLPAPHPAAPMIEPKPWPVRAVDGAGGRLVRIGAFSTVHEAKRGWWAIVRRDPSLERLPALVVPVRSPRNRRPYYRLQMGTTSPAHSAALCQRMRMIARSCVVIGLGDAGNKAAG
jgi:hypothetical protein